MRNYSKLGLPVLLLCFSFLLYADLFISFMHKKNAQPVSKPKQLVFCQTCCDCANFKKDSEKYQEAGCGFIEEACKKQVKGGTGPVVVGGSRNEFFSNDCSCGQNNLIFIGRSTRIISTMKGTKRTTPIHVLVTITDSKGRKVFFK